MSSVAIHSLPTTPRNPTARNLPKSFWLAVALIVGPLLLLITLETYQAMSRTPALRQTGDLVVHTFAVITTAQALDRALQDAERGQHAYLMTGDARYLEPYRVGTQRVPGLLGKLRQLTANDPDQRLRVPGLERQVNAKLAEMQGAVEIRQQKGFAAARRLLLTDGSPTAAAAVSGLIESAITAENTLLTARLARLTEQERGTASAALWSDVLAFSTMVVGVFLTVWVLRRTQAIEGARRKSEQHLLHQQRTLEQTRAALAQAQKMDALGQLTGGIAHDFNNLLHVIRSCIGLLQRRLRSVDAEVQQFLDMIERNTNLAASLTQQLLAFARRQPLEPKPTNVNTLVSEMANLLRRALGERIELATVLTDDVWTASADANQLEVAVLNLAVNARDAMPRGGRVTIETANVVLDETYAAAHAEVVPGEYAMVAVSDTGMGMTPEILAKAFDPFFTTKDVGHGTGLGLSQVYGFVRQSGGHVEIHSEPGRGTTVRIYLRRLGEDSISRSVPSLRPQ